MESLMKRPIIMQQLPISVNMGASLWVKHRANQKNVLLSYIARPLSAHVMALQSERRNMSLMGRCNDDDIMP
jgi:hypothetical protein